MTEVTIKRQKFDQGSGHVIDQIEITIKDEFETMETVTEEAMRRLREIADFKLQKYNHSVI